MKTTHLALLFFTLTSFSRAEYGPWIDADNNCLDTRQEVLVAESLDDVVIRGCEVISGKWLDNYTGKYYTSPKKLDIDHLVPLAEVDKSGGSKWPRSKKIAYANDLENRETLIAVSASQNRAKGDKDPSKWLPANKAYHCQYAKDWLKVKKTWQLEIDDKEQKALDKILASCQN